MYRLVEIYHKIEGFLARGASPPTPDYFGQRYRTRFDAIQGLCDHLRASGLVNYLIVWKAADGRFLVTKGNQRLCALRSLRQLVQNRISGGVEPTEQDRKWLVLFDGVPCRVTEDFRKEWHILAVHPYSAIQGV